MNLELANPVMNAACSVAKTIDDITALSQTSIGAVTIGSITPEPREGNPEPRWYHSDSFALNSFGMPNEGLAFYKDNLPQMIDIIHSSGKKANLSIAGFSIDDYRALAVMADQTEIDSLELNLGCPNVQIDGKQKPIASFDQEYMKAIILAVSEVSSKQLFVKLSPYSNPAELQQVASLLSTLPITAVVTSNTFANGYFEQDGTSVVGAGFGGVSSKALLPIGLGQVKQFRAALPPHIAVIGVGGVTTPHDVSQYLSAGAIAVQVASLIVEEGHAALDGVTA